MKAMILATAISVSLGACGVLAPKGQGTLPQGATATATSGDSARNFGQRNEVYQNAGGGGG